MVTLKEILFNRFIGTVTSETEIKHIRQQVLGWRIRSGCFENMIKVVMVQVILLIESTIITTKEYKQV